MFTTGFKFYFGVFVALAVAAVVYGYASGGDHVGPWTLGWKGGVGDHIGYGVLVGLATVTLFLSLVIVSFRDADPAAQAHLQGVEGLASTSPVSASIWPVVGAFGAGTAVVGLVLHPVVFGLGIVIIALTVLEWTMDAWSDRATGDVAANRQLRNRIMGPIEIPMIGALAIGVTVLAASRILLTVSQLGAVIVAGVLATLILAGAVVYVYKPGIGRQLISGLAVLGALALMVGGVVAAVNGERDFEHHEEESETEGSDAEGAVGVEGAAGD